MPFESLSFRHSLFISGYPEGWFQFLNLYDADLPLFPLVYFHISSDGEAMEAKDRAFGYVESVRPSVSGLEVELVCNKNLNDSGSSKFLSQVESEIRERLGAVNPVSHHDVISAFRPPSDPANAVLDEIWKRVVSPVLGDKLPFGRLYDPVFGLARMLASFYSPGGRKAEWIQTHYFCSRFGEKIPIIGPMPQMDFFLLPTFKEIIHPKGLSSTFPKFSELCAGAAEFHTKFCAVESIGGGLTFSKFNPQFEGHLNSEKVLGCFYLLNQSVRRPLVECFNAFDKGPLRTIMFLQMLNDITSGRLNPSLFTSDQFGLIYDSLGGFYQTPKVIALYAQQCFGNVSALPIDTWVNTFLKWPLMVHPTSRGWRGFFQHANNLGKVERLVWITAQARKVHSSLCDNALWCIKYDSEREPRGSNPLACAACLKSIRNACPAYAKIANATVSFNTRGSLATFRVTTSKRENISPDQTFELSEGTTIYGKTHDDFTPIDAPESFRKFPQSGHKGQDLTVVQFVETYESNR